MSDPFAPRSPHSFRGQNNMLPLQRLIIVHGEDNDTNQERLTTHLF